MRPAAAARFEAACAVCADTSTTAAAAPLVSLLLLQGKLVLWRCVFVTHLLVILVLGSFAWSGAEGQSLARRRAEAFNVLVFGEQCVRARVQPTGWHAMQQQQHESNPQGRGICCCSIRRACSVVLARSKSITPVVMCF